MKTASKKKVASPDNIPMYRFDSLTGFWGIENISHKVSFDMGDVEELHVKFNEFGNRDQSIKKDEGTKNFICIGGSHTWGAYVDQDSRYSDILNRQTNRRFLNMGHPSFGLDQILLTIENRCAQFNPEGIIIEQYPWAFHRVMNSYVNGYLKPYFYLTKNKELEYVPISPFSRFKSYRRIVGDYRMFKKELQETMHDIDVKDQYEAAYDPVFLLWKTPYYEYAYELYGKIVERLKKFCEEKNIKLMIFLTANLQLFSQESKSALIDYDLPTKKLCQVLDKYNVPFVDFSQRLVEEQQNGSDVVFSDGHLNYHGHQKVSDYLMEEMKNRRWL